MVKIIPTDDENVFKLESEFESWYPLPDTVNAREAAYLDAIQSTVHVEDALGNWIPYRMCNHQVEWHLDDVTIKQEAAPIRVVKKSRNTSLTINSAISDLFAQSEFNNPIVPYVRLNGRSAFDLISQVKQIIKHITPLVFEETDTSRQLAPDIPAPTRKVYYPFNPKEVKLDSAGSIQFPSGSIIRAFPANSDASETIRGLRLRGNYGFIDEANFMRLFKNVFVAMRDASAGTKDGMKIQQFTIGSTLKGETPFTEWLEAIEKSGAKRIKIYDWPVFRRDVFEPYMKGACEIPFHENPALVSIVPWHDKKELWETWLQDKHVFLEEYMAEKVESDDQFYPTPLIIKMCDIDDTIPVEELAEWIVNYNEIRIGIDPASIHDYFAICVFGIQNDGHVEQLLVEGHRGIELHQMQAYCDNLLSIINDNCRNWLCSIDATPIGLQITQTLRKQYGPRHIRGLNGNMRLQNADGLKVKLNEFGHTMLKKMLYDGKLHLIADELQIRHFKVWDYTYSAPSGQHGHGDLVMACLYALIPLDTKFTEEVPLSFSGKASAIETMQQKHQDRLLKEFRKRIARR